MIPNEPNKIQKPIWNINNIRRGSKRNYIKNIQQLVKNPQDKTSMAGES